MVKEMEGSWSGAGAELEPAGAVWSKSSRRGFLIEHKHVYASQQGIFSLSSLQGLRRNHGLKFLIVSRIRVVH